MKTKEAKQLMPGDRVLIEAEIDGLCGDIFDGNRVLIAIKGYDRSVNVDPEDIHKRLLPSCIQSKLPPPMRRKFKKGDIVRWNVPWGYIFEATDNETKNGTINSKHGASYCASDIVLVCPVEERKDWRS